MCNIATKLILLHQCTSANPDPDLIYFRSLTFLAGNITGSGSQWANFSDLDFVNLSFYQDPDVPGSTNCYQKNNCENIQM